MIARICVAVATMVAAVCILSAGRSALASGGTPPAPNGDDLQVGPGAALFLDPDPGDADNAKRKGGEDGDDEFKGNDVKGGGLVYHFGLWARTADRSMLMNVRGPSFPGMCSVHGPGAFVDFASEGGNNPYPDIQCGRGFNNDVAFDRCQATLDFHSFVHSDRSAQAYLGSATTDVRFRKTGARTGTLRVDIYTPKTVIVLQGRVESPTPIVMTSCPL